MDEFNKGEENVYSEESREEYIESDSISPEEEGFMKGYEEAEKDEEKKENNEEEAEKDLEEEQE